MRRLTLGLLLGVLLAVPATLVAAPPKATNVVTPMREDLDANGYSIANANAITATGNITAQSNIQTSGYFVGDKLVAMSGELILEPHDTAVISILSGRDSPVGRQMNQGAVYLRSYPRADGNYYGEMWLKAGPAAIDWTCVAGC